MRQIALTGALVLFFFPIPGTGQASPMKEQALPVAAPAYLLDTESYVHSLVPTAEAAIRFLAASRDPIFADKMGIALQTLPTQQVAATVLFPTKSSFSEYLATIPASIHALCRIVRRHPPNYMQPIIVCDPDGLRRMDILIRVGHSPSFLTYTSNDWRLMNLLERIRHDPAGVLKEAHPRLLEAHAQDHMAFLLSFLLAHESWHLAHQSSSGFAPTEMLNTEGVGELDERILCRNYQEFLRHGVRLDFGDDPAELIENETPPNNPHVLDKFDESRAIWKDELEADEYAAEAMARLVHFVAHTAKLKKLDVEQVTSEIIQEFGYIMMTNWYSQIYAFSQEYCGAYADQDFFLSRCLCNDIKLYKKLKPWFSDTHPPMILRMYVASMEFLLRIKEAGDVDATTTKNPQLMLGLKWLLMMKALLDVPLKLSVAECVMLPQIGYDGTLTQILPDFAGFGPKRSTKYFGYPADEPGFLMSCVKSSAAPKQIGPKPNRPGEMRSKDLPAGPP